MSILGKLLSEQFSRLLNLNKAGTSANSLEEDHVMMASPGTKIFLYVGCGHDHGANIRHGFVDGWQEIRFDIDAAVHPDVVGTLLDMSGVPSASIDAVYTAHTLEHIYAHEVPVALAEIRRVLKPSGIVLTIVPDLQSTAKVIAEDRLYETLYVSPIGPITPFDILYGHQNLVQGNVFMAHRSGFTLSSLSEALKVAGFKSVIGIRREEAFDLGTIATCETLSDDKLKALLETHLPT